MNTKTFLIPTALSVGALIFLPFAAGVADAQGRADVEKPSFDELPSPDLDGTKRKSFDPKDWLEVESEIEIPPLNREMAEVGFIDRVLVKWYVAIEEKASGRPVLLTKDITHVNVQVEEPFYSSVYLSPNTLLRLTGDERAAKNKVKAVALEVLVNGVKVGEATDGEGSGWWNAPSLSRGDRFPLLNKNETPFKVYWWDRYAEIEEER